MDRCRIWFPCWLGLLLAGCGATNFQVAQQVDPDLKGFSVQSIDYDLAVRCKLKVSTPTKTESGNCLFWVGQDRVQLEISHPLAGLLVFAQVKGGELKLLDGATGRPVSQPSSLFPRALLKLTPLELKALLLGRRLAAIKGFEGAGQPKELHLERDGTSLHWKAERWFMQQGLSVPRVIQISTAKVEIRLVSLEVKLGRGGALEEP